MGNVVAPDLVKRLHTKCSVQLVRYGQVLNRGRFVRMTPWLLGHQVEIAQQAVNLESTNAMALFSNQSGYCSTARGATTFRLAPSVTGRANGLTPFRQFLATCLPQRSSSPDLEPATLHHA